MRNVLRDVQQRLLGLVRLERVHSGLVSYCGGLRGLFGPFCRVFGGERAGMTGVQRGFVSASRGLWLGPGCGTIPIGNVLCSERILGKRKLLSDSSAVFLLRGRITEPLCQLLPVQCLPTLS